MFVHGELDAEYPPSQSSRMHEALRQAGVDSVCRIVPAAGHGLPECDPDTAAALLDESVAFLRDRL